MIQCNHYHKQHMGETKRRLKDRFNEHRRPVNKQTPQLTVLSLPQYPNIFCVTIIALYIITQVILAFWLVPAYDLLEDRRTIDVIIIKVFPSAILKWRKVLRIRIIFNVTGQKIRNKKDLPRHWTGSRSRRTKDKVVSFRKCRYRNSFLAASVGSWARLLAVPKFIRELGRVSKF